MLMPQLQKLASALIVNAKMNLIHQYLITLFEFFLYLVNFYILNYLFSMVASETEYRKKT